MPTNTARLGMTKPNTVGENVDVGAHLNANLDTIDQHMGLRQVTSGTRPSTPWRGMLIEETDTGKVLYWNSTKWALLGGTKPTALVRRTTNQTVGSGTESLVILNDLDTDYLSHADDFTLSSGRLTIKRPGLYLISAHVNWSAATAQGNRKIFVRFNATSGNPFLSSEQPKGTADNVGSTNTCQRLLRTGAATDWIELYALQTSGGNLDVIGPANATQSGSTLSVTWVRE